VNPNPDHDRADFGLLRQDDEAALNRLMARWEQRLFAFAWRYLRNAADAREVVIEVFVRLYQQRARLRPDTNLSVVVHDAGESMPQPASLAPAASVGGV
jgi:hypothetical protein